MSIHATPARQFPLRLEASLADRLDKASKQTHINKTAISRIAISKFLTELEVSGISSAMHDVCEVWYDTKRIRTTWEEVYLHTKN